MIKNWKISQPSGGQLPYHPTYLYLIILEGHPVSENEIVWNKMKKLFETFDKRQGMTAVTWNKVNDIKERDRNNIFNKEKTKNWKGVKTNLIIFSTFKLAFLSGRIMVWSASDGSSISSTEYRGVSLPDGSPAYNRSSLVAVRLLAWDKEL